MLSIGYDIGSSSIKCSIINIEKGSVVSEGSYPSEEMEITSPKPNWAEQDPELWWKYIKIITKDLIKKGSVKADEVVSIGLSYQMHGLVIVDKNQNVLRPSIIWCDSRAVQIGNNAFEAIGKQKCLSNLLNSPGNFTASKLRWVRENEPDVYKNIHKAMLPGDYIAMKLSGEINTTYSGLSEGIYWDFKENQLSKDVLSYYDIDENILPAPNNTFSVQGKLTKQAAEELGLKEGIVISYRAGDQPNNAFSLNVLNPGEIAATGGTSGVVYGITEKVNYDSLSRVNQFAHVNYSKENTRLGVLLCINGTGIQYSWMRKNTGTNLSYSEINKLIEKVPIGSEGLIAIPFGNGAERMLENKNTNAHILGIDFNRHSHPHLFRSIQEGIAFSFKYGMDIMRDMGLKMDVIRASKANMFLSPTFRQTLSNITGATIELYDTNGSQGAARGAAVGAGYYKSFKEAFTNLTLLETVKPEEKDLEVTKNFYQNWYEQLKKFL
ncbi:MAG: carbohydrate kinase [Ignavibacteriales bacterium]|nr:MAG: carbohydrate kinase [Ignavibacteriales bacterium]